MTPMIATFTALLFAHVVADFMLQTNKMVENKRSFKTLAIHGALVLATAQLALGHAAAPILLALAIAHVAIDVIKTYGNFRSFTAFCVDQLAHLITLAATAYVAPTLWATGAWSAMPNALPLMALATGVIITLFAGQYAIALFMRPHSIRQQNKGLRDGGRQIGLLERGLIFLFILTGHPIGVGFLIGAKSILRFGTASRDQRTAEYVIIGTLASFGWAIVAALFTQGALSLLPPLEIIPSAP